MENLKNLQPIYSSRKSFYGKAKVLSLNETTHALYSYGELVAAVKDNEVRLCYYWDCSSTTTRHIHEFLAQYAFGFDYFTTQALRNSLRFFKGDYILLRSWGFNGTL